MQNAAIISDFVPQIVKNLLDVAKVCMDRGEFAVPLTHLQKCLVLMLPVEEFHDSRLLAQVYLYVGKCFLQRNRTSALVYLKKADEIACHYHMSTEDLILLHQSLATVYRVTDDEELEYHHLLGIYQISMECLDPDSNESIGYLNDILEFLETRGKVGELMSFVREDVQNTDICSRRGIMFMYYAGAVAENSMEAALHFSRFLHCLESDNILEHIGVEDPDSYIKRAWGGFHDLVRGILTAGPVLDDDIDVGNILNLLFDLGEILELD